MCCESVQGTTGAHLHLEDKRRLVSPNNLATFHTPLILNGADGFEHCKQVLVGMDSIAGLLGGVNAWLLTWPIPFAMDPLPLGSGVHSECSD